MIKTYRFLSAFVLYIAAGNLLTGQILMLIGGEGPFTAVTLNMIAVYLGVLWVVLKLLQAHFPDKMLKIEYGDAAKKRMKIGLIASLIVCAVLLGLDIPGFFRADYNPGATYSALLLWYTDVRIPSVLSPLRSLPEVVIILLVNGYIRLFYRLADRMAEHKAETPEQTAASLPNAQRGDQSE